MKESLKERWQSQTAFEKFSVVITLPLALAVLIAILLCMTHKISNTISNYIIFASLFIVTMINGLLTVRQDKKNAIVIFICAAVIFACGVLLLFL